MHLYLYKQDPSRYLLDQSQQWRHQNNVWNLFKVKNKGNKMKLITSVVFIIDFEQVNIGWDSN